jgi:saccharopine dehydrogenase (NAD+, L-lysine-forming)
MTARFTLGIRREDKNLWERRAPLIPAHVREFVRGLPVEVRVQPSPNRVFADDDYRREGAVIAEDLSPCSVILAVKEIPADLFLENRVYLFFSHTIKGQPQNMPMLRKMVERRVTLLDYERIVDERGRRLVFFGRQAGQAGLIDVLWALGRSLEHAGMKTPFSGVRRTFDCASLVEAKEEIERLGWTIRERGLPDGLAPLVFGFAGYGHVSLGAQEIFDLLPFEEIAPARLRRLFDKKDYSDRKLYKVVFHEEDMVRPVGRGRSFVLQDYYDHPEGYRPVLEKHLPFLTALVNAIFWSPRFPRFVTKRFLKTLWAGPVAPRLRIIGDLSCDIQGGIECTLRCTSPGDPLFTYDVDSEEARDGFRGRGPAVLAVENLPAEIPLESSVFFSEVLRPFIPALAAADFSKEFAGLELPPPLKKAVILHRGNFAPDYEYMAEFIR